MSSLKVLFVAKIVGNESSTQEKKYALIFDAASNPTVSDLTQRIRTMEAFADPTLRLIELTAEDEHFGTVNVDEAQPLVNLQAYTATFRKEDNEARSRPNFSEGDTRRGGTERRYDQKKKQIKPEPEAALDTTQEPMNTTLPPDTAQKEEAVLSKRALRGRAARKSSGTTPAKKAKVAHVPTPAARKNITEDEKPDTEAQKVPQAIFENRKFVLTSATRVNRAGQSQFNKREFRALIEQRGGTIIDDFKGLGDNDEAYLVADTHYRTHKYLSALSLSVPCVHHTWITECIEQDMFVDFKEYMLPAGHALGPDGAIHEYKWKPQKGKLMAGKKVWIHSKNDSDPPVVGFVQLWSPIISTAGAKVVRDEDVPQNELDLLEWITAGGIDILLTDPSCESLIFEAMEASDSGEVVGSEWVIEGLIMGELPDTKNARYRHNA